MNDVRDLIPAHKIPAHKRDLAQAKAAVKAGYPAVEPILGELIAWLQDYNWPVAKVLGPFLASLGKPLVPHIWRVLQGDDDVWKYWVLELLLPSLAEVDAAQFRPELERLCFSPRENERREELDQQAQMVLEHFGWMSKEH